MESRYFVFLLTTVVIIVNAEPSKLEPCEGYDCLKNYVEKEDSNYMWSDTGIRLHGMDPLNFDKWTGYVLNFTSQQWLTSEDTSRTIWWHILVVIVPKEVEYPDTPFLWITGGDNEDDPIPKATSYDMIVAGEFAVKSQTVGAALFQIPNQPVTFPGDPFNDTRSGDAIVAYTWWHYMTDPESKAEWLLNLPMTKASVRAMDTITSFLTSDTSPPEVIALSAYPGQYLVAGQSKRAWVAWNTAAVDPRVMGIAPVVMNNLNSTTTLHHQYRVYGGWSFAFKDYYKMNITLMLDDPKMQRMFDIVDSYEYRDKIIVPKLVCDATMDEFFLLDSPNYWWDDMPHKYELNRYLITPNSEHTQITGFLELLPAITTWARELIESNLRYIDIDPKVPMNIEERNAKSLKLMDFSNIPRYSWTIDPESGDIILTTEEAPTSVDMWYATTCNNHRRDFRILNLDDPCTCGIDLENFCSNLFVFWKKEPLVETFPGSLTWIAHQDAPLFGRWTAFFVDVQFNGPKPNIPGASEYIEHSWPIGSDGTYEFSTTVSVVPNTFPYPECHGEDCYGELV